jgi:hypothetical protein
LTFFVGTLEDARPSRFSFELTSGELLSHKSTLIGSKQADADLPNAFLIEQQPGMTLPVHFHGAGQFQVAVHGSGTIGKQPLLPVTVHYAGQRTAYGPITAGADGLWYMTLRPIMSPYAFFMPESRALRSSEIPVVHALSKHVATAGPHVGGIAADAEPAVTLLPPSPSGLAAWLVRLAPDSVLRAPVHPGGSGRFHVVVGGDVAHDQRQLGWLATIWSAPGDTDPPVRAGAGGAEMLVLQFPGDACKHPAPQVDSAPPGPVRRRK